jgi:ABC-2 type transport system permease protein
MTRNQVISFVISLAICLLLLLAGWDPVTSFFTKWAPTWLVDAVASFSFIPHYESMRRGVVDIHDIAYYASVIVFMFFSTHVVLENRKSA